MIAFVVAVFALMSFDSVSAIQCGQGFIDILVGGETGLNTVSNFECANSMGICHRYELTTTQEGNRGKNEAFAFL